MFCNGTQRTGLAALGYRAQPNQLRIPHRFLFLLALLSTSVFVWALGATVSSYSGQDDRGAQRTPIIAESSDVRSQTAFVLDRLSGQSLQFTVAYVIPDVTSSPPPGLSKWPEPGEVYLSPALRHAGREEGIESRYGTFAGEISSAGLSSSSELFAYVNPADRIVIDGKFRPVSHYGAARPALIGSLLDREPIGRLLIAIGSLLGVPLALLTRSVTKMGLYRRRYESTILQGLGAKKSEIWRWHLGKILAPLVIWLLAVTLGIVALALFGLWLPGVDFYVEPVDFRRFLPVIAVATFLAGATFILLWIVFSAKSLDTSSSTRPTSTAETYSKQRATVGIVAAPAAVVVAVISAGQESAISFALFVGLAIIVLVTLTDTIGITLLHGARALRRYAARRRDPEVLVTAAVAESRSSAINRMAMTVCIAVIVAVVLQTVLGVMAQTSSSAKSVYDRFKDSVLSLSVMPDMSGAHIDELIKEAAKVQPVHALLLSESVDAHSGQPKLTIALTDPENNWLASNDVANDYVRMRQVAIGNSARIEAPRSMVDALRERDQTLSNQADVAEWELIFVADTAGTLSVPRLKEAFFRLIAPMFYMQMPEESWLVAQTEAMGHIDWIELLVMAGMAFVLLSIFVFTVDENSDGLRRLALMKRISGRPLRVGTMSFIRIGLPIGVGILGGLILAAVFGVSLVLLYGESVSLFTRTLPSIVLTLLVLFAVLWLMSTQNLRRIMEGSK